MKRMSQPTPLALLLLSSLSFLAQADEIELDNPLGGWRGGKGDAEHNGYLQEVHYPANSVNSAPDQGKESLIRGHIKLTPKASPQAKNTASAAAATSEATATTSGEGMIRSYAREAARGPRRGAP